jgi:hypothetical protein
MERVRIKNGKIFIITEKGLVPDTGRIKAAVEAATGERGLPPDGDYIFERGKPLQRVTPDTDLRIV